MRALALSVSATTKAQAPYENGDPPADFPVWDLGDHGSAYSIKTLADGRSLLLKNEEQN
jgi:hypothetical protein